MKFYSDSNALDAVLKMFSSLCIKTSFSGKCGPIPELNANAIDIDICYRCDKRR